MTQDALIPALSNTPATARQQSQHPYSWAAPSTWRHAKPLRCRRCKTPILRGYDEDWCAFRVDVDTAPLTALGEALALLAGLRTCTLTQRHERISITRRNHHAIASRPAGSRGLDVVTEHVCGSMPLPTAPSQLFEPPSITVDDGPPPF